MSVLDDLLAHIQGIAPQTPANINLGGSVGGVANSGGTYAPALPEQHHGIFGLHGTARDIIGKLGDALLIGGGRNPIYTPGVEDEKRGDALLNYGHDPLGAIQNLSQVDPKMSLSAYNDYVMGKKADAQEQIAAQTAKRQEDRADTQNRVDQDKLDYNTRATAAHMYNAMDPNTYKNGGKDQIQKYLAMRGIGDRLGYTLPDEYDPNFDASSYARNTSQDDQYNYREARLGQMDTQNDIRQQGVNISGRNADIRQQSVDNTDRHYHAQEGIAAHNADTSAVRANEGIRHDHVSEANQASKNVFGTHPAAAPALQPPRPPNGPNDRIGFKNKAGQVIQFVPTPDGKHWIQK